MDKTTHVPLFRPALRREMRHRLILCGSPVERPAAILHDFRRAAADAARRPAPVHGEAP